MLGTLVVSQRVRLKKVLTEDSKIDSDPRF